MGQESKKGEQKRALTAQQIGRIQEVAATIRHGSINLVFQDGILIQINKSEKIRVSKT